MEQRILSLALLTAMLALVSVSAQQPPTTNDPPEVVGGLAFIDEVELTVVNIDVFVTKKGGQAVTDLEVDDFLVRQDGRERQLSHFALYTEEEITHHSTPSGESWSKTSGASACPSHQSRSERSRAA